MPPMQGAAHRQADPDAAAVAAWVERGDRAALQEVFERHADAALRLAASRLGNRSDAEDAVQHAFIGVMRGARSYRPEAGTVRGYILAAVVNACAEQRRSEGARRARELIVRAAEEAAPRDPDLADALREALARLPEHQRQPVELRYLAGLEFPEIAAALGRNERTVRGQVTRGLDSLREICPKLGVRIGPAAFVAALGSLASPAPSAEAAERCAAIAATGPRAVSAKGPALVLGGILAAILALAMLLLALRSGHHAPAALPSTADAAPAIAAAKPATPPPAPIVERDLGSSFLVWSIPDDATTADAPLVSIGTGRLVDDGVGGSVEWWRQPTVPQIDQWTWGPSPKRASRKGPPWTPSRLLGAPRVGEEAFLVCVTPRPIPGGDYSMVSPASLVATADGWKLTLDGFHIDPVTFAGSHTTDIRGCYAFDLGRLTHGASRLQVEVHWRDMHAAGSTFPEAASVQRGEVTITDGTVASLPELTAGGAVETADPTRWWQVPLAKPSLPLADADAPAEFGGLIDASDGPMMRAYRAAGHRDESGSVYVLGPGLADDDTMTLRSIVWHGPTATITVAVWERAGGTPAPVKRRRLMPVMLQPPAGLHGAYGIELEWRHFVADPTSAGFVLQAGRPSFAGTTHASAAVPTPKTDL
jgi:RNA polymerase sigma-70 factor (ECF subfamily)